MLEIRNVGGHIEVYENDIFILSADNKHEAENELRQDGLEEAS